MDVVGRVPLVERRARHAPRNPQPRDAAGAVRSYSTEYLPGPVDESLLKELSRSTGGRFGISPQASFDPDLPGSSRRVELFTPLLLVALLLFPVDIALRRVLVGQENLRAGVAAGPATQRSRRPETMAWAGSWGPRAGAGLRAGLAPTRNPVKLPESRGGRKTRRRAAAGALADRR